MLAGFATLNITPLPCVPMAGYPSRSNAAIGVHDHLQVQALWLETKEGALALVSVDLFGVDRSMTREVRRLLGDILPSHNLILAATHTHSGPAVFRDYPNLWCEPPGDSEVIQTIVEKIAYVVLTAQKSAYPVLMGFNRNLVQGVASNRRGLNRSLDSWITVLRFEGANGNSFANIVHYACHPTILDNKNLYYSADFPGIVRQVVEMHTGTPTMFLNGESGDISTRFTKRDASFAEMERLGRLLGEKSLQALSDVEMLEGHRLAISREQLNLPTRQLPTIEKSQQVFQEAVNNYRKIKASGASKADLRIAETAVAGARRMLEFAYEGLPAKLETEVTVAMLGDLILVAIPGELFSDLSQELIRRLKQFTLIIGYANDYVGYLLSEHISDGFEASAAVVSTRGVNKIIQSIIDLVREIKNR